MSVDSQNPDYTNIYSGKMILFSLKDIRVQDRPGYVMSLSCIENSAG